MHQAILVLELFFLLLKLFFLSIFLFLFEILLPPFYQASQPVKTHKGGGLWPPAPASISIRR